MNQTHTTIVVVDDDADIVEFLCDYLRGMGFNPVSCAVGPRAAACIAQHAPRLVILDLDLGAMCGTDVFQAMRADSVTALVPVIFFTCNADRLRSELAHYKTLNAALVVKPDIAGLTARMHDILQQQA